MNVGNLISDPSAFSKSSLYIWQFPVHVLLRPSLKDFEHYLAQNVKWAQLYSSLNILWHCLSLGLEWKLTFSNPVVIAEYSKFAGILSAASCLRIFNCLAGILSPSLALFIIIFFKAHLTSHSRMAGSRWVITPSWLPGSWRSFLYSSSVYYWHLFLISSASVRFIPYLSFIVPIFAWNVPLVSLIFLKRSLVFPILLFSSIS